LNSGARADCCATVAIFQLILALVFLAVASFIAVMNWCCVISTWRNKRRGIDKHHSTVPIVSLFACAIASMAWPYAHKGWLVVPAALDIGNWIIPIGLLVLLPMSALRKARESRAINQADLESSSKP
jgi:hypothetical protein